LKPEDKEEGVVLIVDPPDDLPAFIEALVASGMREAHCENPACTTEGRRFFTRTAARCPELCPPCSGELDLDPNAVS